MTLTSAVQKIVMLRVELILFLHLDVGHYRIVGHFSMSLIFNIAHFILRISPLG